MKPGRILCGLTVAAVGLLGGCVGGAPAESVTSEGPTIAGSSVGGAALPADLEVAEFADLVATTGVVVLDVRTPMEYDSGHLAGAINIDVHGADFGERIAGLGRGATYAIYCQSGNRSRVALDQMAVAGFTDVHHLIGGIGAWQRAGMPVVQDG